MGYAVERGKCEGQVRRCRRISGNDMDNLTQQRMLWADVEGWKCTRNGLGLGEPETKVKVKEQQRPRGCSKLRNLVTGRSRPTMMRQLAIDAWADSYATVGNGTAERGTDRKDRVTETVGAVRAVGGWMREGGRGWMREERGERREDRTICK